MHIHVNTMINATTPTMIGTTNIVQCFFCCFTVGDELLLVISVVSFVLIVVCFENMFGVTFVSFVGVDLAGSTHSENLKDSFELY